VSRSQGHVLVVDDDPSARQSLADALRALDFDVHEAADGPSALRIVEATDPDVILLDVIMPGMDGYEVCRRLKEDPETALTPVIFLTGYGSREAKLEGLDAGATEFLSKPCELVELEIRVRNLVRFAQMTRELENAEQMVFSVALAVEARDQETAGHCDRLAAQSVELGRRLGMDDDGLVALRRGGYLHDIGKIGVPDAVLLKPGRLNDDEWVQMKRHVDIGVEILGPLKSLRPVLPIIRHHHERWDGSGYPDGLVGEEIPLIARIFQVVDVWDALTNDRCYRKALSAERALGIIIEECERGWWDPCIVSEFEAMIREQRPRDTASAGGVPLPASPGEPTPDPEWHPVP
jgi:putative two-component system response regulator